MSTAVELHRAPTAPYSSSSNGQVERYNWTLMDSVPCFIGKQQIAGTLRISVNRQTDFTAKRLMFGRQ